MLLDTTYLIDLMNGDEGAVEKARELEENLVQQRLSAITLFELYHGVARSTKTEAERRKVENVLASKPVHPADATVMQKAGRLSGELMNEGDAVADGGVIIGATAEVVDESVLTRNEDDFDRLGVPIQTY